MDCSISVAIASISARMKVSLAKRREKEWGAPDSPFSTETQLSVEAAHLVGGLRQLRSRTLDLLRGRRRSGG